MFRRFVRYTSAGLGLLIVGLAANQLLFAPASLPGGFRDGTVALEFADSPERLNAALTALGRGNPIAGREKALADLVWDDRLIIPVYVLVLACIGLVLSRDLTGGERRFGWILIGLAVAAGLTDLIENNAIRAVLHAVGGETSGEPPFERLVNASTAKWAFLAGCAAAIGGAFRSSARTRVSAVVALSNAFVWGIGLANPKWRPLVEWGLLLFGGTFVAVWWGLRKDAQGGSAA